MEDGGEKFKRVGSQDLSQERGSRGGDQQWGKPLSPLAGNCNVGGGNCKVGGGNFCGSHMTC